MQELSEKDSKFDCEGSAYIILFNSMESVIQALQYEERLLKNRLQRIENECMSRPKGSIVIKKRYHMLYAYLQWREENRVVSQYLGKPDSWKCRSIQAKVLERKKYEQEMKELRSQLKKVEHLLKEVKKFS